jgi:transposase
MLGGQYVEFCCRSYEEVLKRTGGLATSISPVQKLNRGEKMENQAAVVEENIAGKLYLAFELSLKKWKLGFMDGRSPKVRMVSISSGDLQALAREVEKARKQFGMGESYSVISCYEAGREGFWVHRALEQRGIQNQVVDASSIEVNRRQRRAKTDRMDAERLVRQLVRYFRGERDAMRMVRVPSREDEDRRHLHRGLETLKEERKQHRVRIQSLLFTQGVQVKVGTQFSRQLGELRCWNEEPVPSQLKERIEAEYHRLQLVEVQIREIQARQKEQLSAQVQAAAQEKVRRLQRLVGVGLGSSWIFVMELFGWRVFRNRRELAAAVGLAPTPYNSGEDIREQGISRAGNSRIRKLLIEIAWAWLRFQPQTKLSQWYQLRFAKAGKRMRRIGIVAVARRLVIDLWRYVETEAIPAGARLRSVAE